MDPGEGRDATLVHAREWRREAIVVGLSAPCLQPQHQLGGVRVRERARSRPPERQTISQLRSQVDELLATIVIVFQINQCFKIITCFKKLN